MRTHDDTMTARAVPEGTAPASGTMSLWDHIEDMRWMILKSMAALLVAAGIGMALASPVYEALAVPLRSVAGESVELVFTSPMDAFLVRIKLALAVGFVLALPFVLAFVWTFVAPGLETREKRVIFVAVAAGSVLFCGGAAFGYMLLATGLSALVRIGVSGTGARHLWTLTAYLSFCLRFMMAFGAVFELPVILLVLSRLGVVTTAGLRGFRRHALVGAFVIGAVLTPPDALTQIMVAVPLVVMYELSIWVSAAMDRRRRATVQAPAAGAEAET